MVRIKNVPSKIKTHAKSLLKRASAAIGKKKSSSSSSDKVVHHTGKLKVPFKPAAPAASAPAGSYAKVKKGLVKLIKRRWRSGTVAKREIRKLSRTTHNLLPKRPFNRLVRELSQDFKSDVRFTKESIHAIQECAEMFVCGMFMKSDIARHFAGRKTLLAKDVKFAGFMRDECIWQFPSSSSSTSSSSSSSLAAAPSSSSAVKTPKQAPRLKLNAAGIDKNDENPTAPAPAAEEPKGNKKKKKASGDNDDEGAAPAAPAPPPAAKKAKAAPAAAAAAAAAEGGSSSDSSSGEEDEDGSSSSAGEEDDSDENGAAATAEAGAKK